MFIFDWLVNSSLLFAVTAPAVLEVCRVLTLKCPNCHPAHSGTQIPPPGDLHIEYYFLLSTTTQPWQLTARANTQREQKAPGTVVKEQVWVIFHQLLAGALVQNFGALHEFQMFLKKTPLLILPSTVNQRRSHLYLLLHVLGPWPVIHRWGMM